MSNNKLTYSIEHVFRSEYTKLVSVLTSKFGPSHLDIIEDAIQDALYKAMQLWSYQASPSDPGKWLYKVAYNRVIDLLRRNNKTEEYKIDETQGGTTMDFPSEHGIEDDQLMMIFACCHPTLKESEQIMLSLKLLCGFSNKEIARAFIKQPEAVKKSITRAKQKFKTDIGELRIPEENKLIERLNAVLKVIYLLFNNGYTVVDGDALLNKDVCEDAIRLALFLHKKDKYDSPELRALLALMYFNYSRFNARLNDASELITLENQDRGLWDRKYIQKANDFFESSASGDSFSKYHIESAIAREYSISSSFETTNWSQILGYYDILSNYYPSPMVSLNRVVVLEKVHGAALAMDAFNRLDKTPYANSHLYFAIKADLEIKLKNNNFKKSLQQAIELSKNTKEKAFLLRKLEQH